MLNRLVGGRAGDLLITDVGEELATRPVDARPGHVIVVVMTDGHENSSREWTHETVGAAIQRQESDYAATGEPTGPAGEPRWRQYRDGDRADLLLDKRDAVVEDPDRPLREAWGNDVLSFR